MTFALNIRDRQTRLSMDMLTMSYDLQAHNNAGSACTPLGPDPDAFAPH